MEPLIVLIVVTLAVFVAGAAGVQRLRSWPVALRAGVSAMFVLTGTVHFNSFRYPKVSPYSYGQVPMSDRWCIQIRLL